MDHCMRHFAVEFASNACNAFSRSAFCRPVLSIFKHLLIAGKAGSGSNASFMAALSLTCKQCNTSLKSVKEAQEHGEVTGHSQFEESTEPVGC